MTNEQHNRYIGYAFLANAGFYLLIMAFVAVLFLIIGTFPPGNDPGPPPFFLGLMFGFMALIYGMFALPSVIAGYGVLKHKSWARTASIVAGVIAGMNFPIGTGACVYALWFFFSDNWKEIYPDQAFPFEPKQISYGVESQRAAYAEAERTRREPHFDPYNPPDWR